MGGHAIAALVLAEALVPKVERAAEKRASKPGQRPRGFFARGRKKDRVKERPAGLEGGRIAVQT